MGRKSNDVMTFRIHSDYRERLEAEAEALGVTLSRHIRTVLMNHSERTELRNISEVLRLLVKKIQKLEGELRQFRSEFEDAVR